MVNLTDRIGITEIGALMSWVRSVSGKHFNVKFEVGAETAYVDSRGNMVIPAPNASMTVRDGIRLRGFCIHETSHPMYQPDIFTIMEKYRPDPQSPLSAIFNIFLDVHCETRRKTDWPADGKALSEFGAVVGFDVTQRLEPEFIRNGRVWPPNFAKTAAIMLAARNAEGSWNTGLMVGFKRLAYDLYTQEMRDVAADLESKFKLTEVLVENADATTEYDIWELSKKVFEYLYGVPPESQMANPEGDGQGKPKPKPGEKGDKPEKSKGKGKGEPKPEDGEGDKEGEVRETPASGDEQSKDPSERLAEELAEEKIKVTDLLNMDHYETMLGGGHGKGFDYSKYTSHSAYVPVDPLTFKIVKFDGSK